MTTITMTIDEETLTRARQKAEALETSVGEVVVVYLRQWVQNDAIEQARTAMSERFAQPDWRFAVGTPDNREQRNAMPCRCSGIRKAAS